MDLLTIYYSLIVKQHMNNTHNAQCARNTEMGCVLYFLGKRSKLTMSFLYQYVACDPFYDTSSIHRGVICNIYTLIVGWVTFKASSLQFIRKVFFWKKWRKKS